MDVEVDSDFGSETIEEGLTASQAHTPLHATPEAARRGEVMM